MNLHESLFLLRHILCQQVLTILSSMYIDRFVLDQEQVIDRSSFLYLAVSNRRFLRIHVSLEPNQRGD